MLIGSAEMNLVLGEPHRNEMNERVTPSLPPDFEVLMEKGFALAVQLIGSREDAADVLQESWRKLLHGDGFQAKRGSRQAWFLKVVRNRSFDILRSRKRHDAEEVAYLLARGPGPDLQASERELGSLLRSELDAMPPEQREIVLLRDFHDLTYSEIAEVMGIAKGTVMSRLHRARTALRERMRRYL